MIKLNFDNIEWEFEISESEICYEIDIDEYMQKLTDKICKHDNFHYETRTEISDLWPETIKGRELIKICHGCLKIIAVADIEYGSDGIDSCHYLDSN